MFKVQVTGKGAKEISAKLTKLGESLEDFTESMPDIGRELTEYFSGPAFLSQGGVFGQRWPSLSPAYQTYKIRHYRTFSNQILVRSSGQESMQNSFTYSATRDSVTIGNSSDHFKYHQSALPRKKIPRRQMIGVNDEVSAKVNRIIEDDIKRKLGKF